MSDYSPPPSEIGAPPVNITGTPGAGDVLTATSPTAAHWASASGGGSPGLPVWTFAAADNSDPASGKFTTDVLDTSGVSSINLSNTPKNGGSFSAVAFLIGIGSLLLATDATGKTFVWHVNNVGPQADYFNLSVDTAGGNSGNFSGDYQVTLWPGPPPSAPTLAQILATAGITPIADGSPQISSTLGGSITYQSGITTALSSAS